MNFKELFDKEFLYESKKEDSKTTKIFYKFDINIKKLGSGNEQQNQAPDVNNAPVDTNTAPDVSTAPVDNTATPVDTNVAPVPDVNAAPDTSATPVTTEPAPTLPNVPFSVVTEDDNKNIQVNDDNNIIRKLEGELILSKKDVDNIQTVEDLLTKLTEEKVDGINVLDEFTADILQMIVNPATQQQLKEKVDKESSIFAEILYGKKRENSVGLRIIKRKNSDLLTTSMMIDNKIINAQYKKETLDKRITDYRNDEYDEDNN